MPPSSSDFSTIQRRQIGVAGRYLGVTLAPVLPEVKPGVEGRLGRPPHEFASGRALDELLEDRGRDDHIRGRPVGRDGGALEAG
jgi:hypothetical protein